jgi:hypothetical protein
VVTALAIFVLGVLAAFSTLAAVVFYLDGRAWQAEAERQAAAGGRD